MLLSITNYSYPYTIDIHHLSSCLAQLLQEEDKEPGDFGDPLLGDLQLTHQDHNPRVNERLMDGCMMDASNQYWLESLNPDGNSCTT